MALGEEKLKFFADYIQKELGVVYAPQVYFQLEQRIETIAKYLGLSEAKDVYEKALVEGITGDFKQFLLDTATNNETSFFRDVKVFLAFEKQFLPSLKSQFVGQSLFRIWCAAASFGQEPYSIAMLVYEFLKKNPGHPRIEIIATDVADHALKRCQKAQYSQLEIQRGLSAARIMSYFHKTEEENWKLNPEITSLVTFKKQNLMDAFTSQGIFHIILCRYVLIYQEAHKKKEIMQKFEKCIYPQGYFVMGGSESAFGLSTQLEQQSFEGAIYYQKKT